MNKLPVAKRAQILGMMVGGVSIRATGASKNTIVKLLSDAGQACSEYQDRTLVNLPCKAHSSRRNLELCLRETEGRSAREARAIRLWRCVDLDRALRRYKAHSVLARCRP